MELLDLKSVLRLYKFHKLSPIADIFLISFFKTSIDKNSLNVIRSCLNKNFPLIDRYKY